MVIWFLTRFYSSYEVFTLFDIPSFRLNLKKKKKKKKKKKRGTTGIVRGSPQSVIKSLRYSIEYRSQLGSVIMLLTIHNNSIFLANTQTPDLANTIIEFTSHCQLPSLLADWP